MGGTEMSWHKPPACVGRGQCYMIPLTPTKSNGRPRETVHRARAWLRDPQTKSREHGSERGQWGNSRSTEAEEEGSTITGLPPPWRREPQEPPCTPRMLCGWCHLSSCTQSSRTEWLPHWLLSVSPQLPSHTSPSPGTSLSPTWSLGPYSRHMAQQPLWLVGVQGLMGDRGFRWALFLCGAGGAGLPVVSMHPSSPPCILRRSPVTEVTWTSLSSLQQDTTSLAQRHVRDTQLCLVHFKQLKTKTKLK